LVVIRVVLPFLVTAVVVLVAVLGIQAFVRTTRRRERAHQSDLARARATLDEVRTQLLATPMPYDDSVLRSIELIDAELARPLEP
jgi:hypothetical protein